MMIMSEKRLFIEKYETVTSTNDILKAKAASGAPEGTVIVANAQTAGRGRMGRSFYSPAGSGIYMSVLLRPSKDEAARSCITARAAVAAAKAIEKHAKKQVKIKWVNDIYLRERKVCGILTESASDTANKSQAYIIVGIGINLKEPPTGYPDALQGVAGAIFDENEHCDVDALINDILAELFASSPDLLDEYKSRNMLDGKTIVVSQGGAPKYTAEAVGIDDAFGLCIRLPDGTETVLRSGEVTVREIKTTELF